MGVAWFTVFHTLEENEYRFPVSGRGGNKMAGRSWIGTTLGFTTTFGLWHDPPQDEAAAHVGGKVGKEGDSLSKLNSAGGHGHRTERPQLIAPSIPKVAEGRRPQEEGRGVDQASRGLSRHRCARHRCAGSTWCQTSFKIDHPTATSTTTTTTTAPCRPPRSMHCSTGKAGTSSNASNARVGIVCKARQACT